jgi:thiol-disulfide isomerase/thioredoxin
MKFVLRAVTVLLVLCLGLACVLIYRLETAPSAVIASAGPPEASIGKFSPSAEKPPAPDISFADQSGKTATLGDFRGHVVLVNLWATWCVPCIKEMPSLARLQVKLGDLKVLAISEDRQGATVVPPFIEKNRIDGLAIYLDPKNDADHALGVDGLPTSFLIDRDGHILGKLEGAADWDSAAMVALIETYLKS